MVVPHRIMETQGFVTIAPRIPWASVLLDDDGRHLESFQSRPQADAALATTDDDTIRLPGIAQVRFLFRLELEPAFPMFENTMLDTLVASFSRFLRKLLESSHRSQQCPTFTSLQTDMSPSGR